jgi:hypothetical protein
MTQAERVLEIASHPQAQRQRVGDLQQRYPDHRIPGAEQTA